VVKIQTEKEVKISSGVGKRTRVGVGKRRGKCLGSHKLWVKRGLGCLSDCFSYASC